MRFWLPRNKWSYLVGTLNATYMHKVFLNGKLVMQKQRYLFFSFFISFPSSSSFPSISSWSDHSARLTETIPRCTRRKTFSISVVTWVRAHTTQLTHTTRHNSRTRHDTTRHTDDDQDFGFNGELDGIRIWNRAWTDAEVATNYDLPVSYAEGTHLAWTPAHDATRDILQHTRHTRHTHTAD